MKYIIILSFILTACGGGEHRDEVSEEERLAQFCEAQDLDAQLLSVYNVDTGESYLDVQCVKRIPEVKFCKPDNGLGQEC